MKPLLAILLLVANFAVAESARPNVVLCMADDHGWGDTGYNGHPFLRTPQLDAMAANGIRFDRWYAAAPVCSPTRGSVLTGRHPFRYGITYANTGMLKSEEICIAELLKEKGYRTGHFGKWHVGALTTKVKDANRGGPKGAAVFSPPWDNGFDTCFSTESKVPTFDPMLTPSKVSRESKGKPGSPYGTAYWTGLDERVPDDELRGDDSGLIVDRTLRFVAEAAKEKKPFLAVVWFHAPHTPVVADAAHRGLYPDHPKGLYGQHYHGCISAIDDAMGRLREGLAANGVADNTMLWYSSDNGPESGASSGAGTAAHFRGRKRSLYEGGVRVPGLLVWPARVKTPRIVTQPCVSSDYFPTVLDALGIDLPKRPYDGISLLPLIDGIQKTRPQPIGFDSKGVATWNDNRYKLVQSKKSVELYDLKADASESKNIAEAHPEKVANMQKALAAWRASVANSANGGDY
jgi:arylsulfatase A-like enzyme